MPRKYLAEMVIDRIAACKTYQGSKYSDASAFRYFEHSRERDLMHPKTQRQLAYLLEMLRDCGEDETFHYIKHRLLKGAPFPWDETEEA